MILRNLPKAANQLLTANTLLLLLLCFIIFGVTLFPVSWYRAAYVILINLILISIIFCLEKHYQLFSNITVSVLVIMLIIAFINRSALLDGISDCLNIFFFIFAVYRLLAQVAMAKLVTLKVIVQSVSGYLLLGLVFSIVIAQLESVQAGAFSFPEYSNEPGFSKFYDKLYFGFITMGTVGYGDILPKTPFAKSLTTLIGVSGQLYVAIVIAMLIGKYSATPGQSA